MSQNIMYLKPEEVLPPLVQPRVPQATNAPLDDSIRAQGVIQPVPVYWDEDAGKWRIQSGESRWRSVERVGGTLPCFEVKKPTFARFLVLSVHENEPRTELTPIELAWGIKTYFLLRNLAALTAKYDLLNLQEVERDIELSLPSMTFSDPIDQAVARQNWVREFLEQKLEEALEILGTTLDSWKPLISWETVMQEMGLKYSPRRRRQILEVLDLTDDAQGLVIETRMSEAAARRLAQYDPDVQEKIVERVKADKADADEDGPSGQGKDSLTRETIERLKQELTGDSEESGGGKKKKGAAAATADSPFGDFDDDGKKGRQTTLFDRPGYSDDDGAFNQGSSPVSASRRDDRGLHPDFLQVEKLFQSAQTKIASGVGAWGPRDKAAFMDWLVELADAAGVGMKFTTQRPDEDIDLIFSVYDSESEEEE